MERKNLLSELLEEKTEGTSATELPTRSPGFAARGAVGAMGRSLEILSAQHDAAEALAKQLTNGTNVVELDASLIDPSIIRDRMHRESFVSCFDQRTRTTRSRAASASPSAVRTVSNGIRT